MKKIYLDVKPFQETLHESLCGPASLKIVLEYLGLSVSEQELKVLCKTDSVLGTNANGIVRAARQLGFEGLIQDEASYSDIGRFLRSGIPVIVNWFSSGRVDYGDSATPDGHYSVVVGLDDNYVYLQDPELGKLRQLGRADFHRVWFDFSGRSINAGNLIVRQLIAIRKNEGRPVKG